MGSSTSSLPSQPKCGFPLNQDTLTDIELFHSGHGQLVDGLHRLNTVPAQVEDRQAAEVDVGDVADDDWMLVKP